MARLCHSEYAAQKKTLLEDSLLDLMALHRYQDVTVTDICRESGIPRRTFYHYFEGKDGVLESVIEYCCGNALRMCCLIFVWARSRCERAFSRSSGTGNGRTAENWRF